MQLVYNCSFPFAFVLSTVGFIWCGHLTGSGFSTRLSLDLHDLARHNRIEHDGSLGHADAAPGQKYAPTVPDPARIASLLDSQSPNCVKGPAGVGALTLLDLARVRYLRDAELTRPLDRLHTFITRGEVALILLALGAPCGGGPEPFAVPRDRIYQWFVEERLPDDWPGPSTRIGLVNTAKVGNTVRSEVARLARYSQTG